MARGAAVLPPHTKSWGSEQPQISRRDPRAGGLQTRARVAPPPPTTPDHVGESLPAFF